MKKAKKGILIFVLLLCAIFWLVVICRIIFPTHFFYPDFIIKHMSQDDIRNVFGEYDIEHNRIGAYNIYTDFDGTRHYYILYFDEPGGYPELIVEDTKIVYNARMYYDHREEPNYIQLDNYIDTYVKKIILYDTIIEIDGICDYFGISEEEFMKRVMLEAEEICEHYQYTGDDL